MDFVRLDPYRLHELQGSSVRIWDAWGEVHAKAFTVAKAGKLDVLQSIRGALAAHLDKGGVERTFIKTMEPALKRLGWWGRQFVVNARGEAESVQLGSPHRLKTIFRTNMNTAYAAARERQQRDDAGNRSYWQYLSMADLAPREILQAVRQCSYSGMGYHRL